jgi:hypothetical protein
VADRDRIKYAKSGDVSIAYVVSGDGPPDLVFFHGFTGNIEIEHEIHFLAAFLERLAGFSRLITFDRRGTGLSDRLREPATLEVRMDDLRAVLDAVGSERAVRQLGLELRAGLHTGECEVVGDKIAGIASTSGPASRPRRGRRSPRLLDSVGPRRGFRASVR